MKKKHFLILLNVLMCICIVKIGYNIKSYQRKTITPNPLVLFSKNSHGYLNGIPHLSYGSSFMKQLTTFNDYARNVNNLKDASLNYNHTNLINQGFSTKSFKLDGIWKKIIDTYGIWDDITPNSHHPIRQKMIIKNLPPRVTQTIFQIVDNYRQLRKEPDYLMLPNYLESPRTRFDPKNDYTDKEPISYSEECDITIATHVSLSDISNLETLAMNWLGSISVGVYIEQPEDMHDLEERLGNFFEKVEKLKRGRIDYHLLFGRKFLDYNNVEKHPYDYLYPVNALRNLAITQTKTEFVIGININP